MRKGLVCLAFLMIGFAAPARAQFCPGVAPWVFTDVPANDQFCGFITRMATSGITLGCAVIDANNRLYCPKDFVTREQMSAFLGRLSDALFPLNCGTGQVMKWNGTTWSCANDATGAGTGGTVTSISAGTGLQGSPNPITTTGALNLAPGYQLPQGCSNGQVPKSNGAGGWTCQADANSGGSVTSITAGTGLTGGVITGAGTIAADTTYLQRRVTGTCAPGSSIRTINADGTVTCDTLPPLTGDILVSSGFSRWTKFYSTDPVNYSNFANGTYLRATSVGTYTLVNQPDVPVVLYGKSLQFAGVEICTEPGTGNFLSEVRVRTYAHTANLASSSLRATDAVDRTTAACRYYVLATPVVMTAEMGVEVYTDITWTSANTDFGFGRTTYVFQPTGTDAAPIADRVAADVVVLQPADRSQPDLSPEVRR